MENTSIEKIKSLRIEYAKEILDEKKIKKNPFSQFDLWMNEALDAKIHEPHAMNISTVDKNGKPSSRIVLLRDFGKDGFVFYTNYNSKKGKDIMQNAFGAINFFWPELERQIRIQGKLKKVPSRQSDIYFASRPYENRLGAWASNQSEVLKDRKELEKRFEELKFKFKDKDIPRPNHWGGYILKPKEIEFWQGRPSRIHDRIRYKLIEKKWKIERLSP